MLVTALIFNKELCNYELGALYDSFCVSGGTQLSEFKSTGRRSFGMNDQLILSHGAHVHVTVVAENEAGLRSVIYSTPVLIDITPPELCCIEVMLTFRGFKNSTQCDGHGRLMIDSTLLF